MIKVEITFLISILFLIGCNSQISKNILHSASFEDDETSKKHFFLIEPINKSNGIIKARIVDEWESENGLMELTNTFTDEQKNKSVDDYKYDSKSGKVIFIKTNNEFQIGEQSIIQIIQDKDSNFKINLEQTVNLSSHLGSPIVLKHEERMLTKNGKIFNFEYECQGSFKCSKEYFASLIRNSGLSKKMISKKLKSLLRNEIGNLLDNEIASKIEDKSFKKEIENKFEVECFELNNFEIEIK